MSSDDEKPPAPPVRLTSNRGTDILNSSIGMDRPLPKEPDDADRKKKTVKSKKANKLSTYASDKPNISYPTNFEHTVHVGFDPISGEFTVSLFCYHHSRFFYFWLYFFIIIKYRGLFFDHQNIYLSFN